VNWTIGKAALEPEVLKEENKVFDEIDFIEKRAMELLEQDKINFQKGIKTQLSREYLTNYTNSTARSVIDKWWELGDDLWVKMRWKF
jgi:hypothetical protein